VRLNELSPKPGSKKARKRVGRGTGSGHGKTSGRGHKGAGARSGSKAHSTYEGGQMPLQRRLPRLKGEARGRHTVVRPTLYAAVLVKILGDGEIVRAVTVRAHAFSGSARAKIEAAGGNAEVLER
jgi:large subunit ribosomal protein L15